MLHFHEFYWGGELGRGGGIPGVEGGEDLRTGGQGRGGLRFLFWGKGGRMRQGGNGGGVLEIAHLGPACPLPLILLCQVAQGCSAHCNVPVSNPFSPSPPVSPTRADHKRSQNNTKMILVSF